MESSTIGGNTVSNENLQVHVLKQETTEESVLDSKETRICEGCNSRFESYSKLRNHRKSDKALQCQYCCKGYNRYADYRKHYAELHPDKQQLPKYCPKDLADKIVQAKAEKKKDSSHHKTPTLSKVIMDPKRRSSSSKRQQDTTMRDVGGCTSNGTATRRSKRCNSESIEQRCNFNQSSLSPSKSSNELETVTSQPTAAKRTRSQALISPTTPNFLPSSVIGLGVEITKTGKLKAISQHSQHSSSPVVSNDGASATSPQIPSTSIEENADMTTTNPNLTSDDVHDDSNDGGFSPSNQENDENHTCTNIEDQGGHTMEIPYHSRTGKQVAPSLSIVLKESAEMASPGSNMEGTHDKDIFPDQTAVSNLPIVAGRPALEENSTESMKEVVTTCTFENDLLEQLICIWNGDPLNAKRMEPRINVQQLVKLLMCDYTDIKVSGGAMESFINVAEVLGNFVASVLMMDYCRGLGEKEIMLLSRNRNKLGNKELQNVAEYVFAFFLQKHLRLSHPNVPGFLEEIEDEILERMNLDFIDRMMSSQNSITPSISLEATNSIVTAREVQLSFQISNLLIQILHAQLATSVVVRQDNEANKLSMERLLKSTSRMSQFVHTFMAHLSSKDEDGSESAFMFVIRSARMENIGTMEITLPITGENENVSLFVHQLLLERYDWKKESMDISASALYSRQDVDTFADLLYTTNRDKELISRLSRGVCNIAKSVGIGNILKLLFFANDVPVNTLFRENPKSLLPILFLHNNDEDKQQVMSKTIKQVVDGYGLLTDAYKMNLVQDLTVEEMRKLINHQEMEALPNQDRVGLMVHWAHCSVKESAPSGKRKRCSEGVGNAFTDLLQKVNPSIIQGLRGHLILSGYLKPQRQRPALI